MSNMRALRPVLPILVGAALMLTLSFGMRQSLGLFMPSLTRDIAVTITDFTLAIAMQNLVWGVCQPIAGMFADRWGYRPVMMIGALSYVIGMILMATANGVIAVLVGAGICVGIAMACASFAMAMSLTARLVPATIRSTALGIMSAVGSIGAMFIAPLGQLLESSYDWRTGFVGFIVIAILILPAAWIAGRVDKEAPLTLSPDNTDTLSAGAAALAAFRYPPFVMMATAYFVCGMQLIFLTTHLPSYLVLCGLDPMQVKDGQSRPCSVLSICPDPLCWLSISSCHRRRPPPSFLLLSWVSSGLGFPRLWPDRWWKCSVCAGRP